MLNRLCIHQAGLAVAVALAACAPASAPAPAEEGEPAEGAITTSTGFVCPEPSSRAEVTSTELSLFVWTEYIPQDMVDCFEQVYGVTVNMEMYSSNEEMGAKLDAGGSQYDLIQPTDYYVQVLVRKGQLQTLDHERLPVLATFNPNYLNLSFDPNNEYTLPFQAGTYGIVVDTAVVSAPPTSWADLWKAEFVDAGRMVFLDDSRATIGLTLLTLGYDLNSTNEAELAEAQARLAELAPGVKLWDSDSPKSALIAGDVDLGMIWTGEAFLAQLEKPSIEYIYPSDGVIFWQDNYAIPTDAPHLDAAYAWLNYTMQPDVFWLMLRDFPYTHPSQGALDYAASQTFEVMGPDGSGPYTPQQLHERYMASTVTNTPQEAYANAVRIEDVGDAVSIYDRIWTEIKGE
jgi:spermidine/putrescine-binding protein